MTNQVVLFPDAEAVVIDYLEPALVAQAMTVGVTSRVPNPRPASFVTVRRVGGTLETIVTDGATLVVESWAAREQDAMDLAQMARALVHAMEGTVQGAVVVYRVQEFAGPAVLPDTESEQPRVTFTVSVQLRGVAI